MGADFSGYATKSGLKCSDGLTITSQAFRHMNGTKVPLLWQHGHNDPENVLGHVELEARNDGVYAHGFFNDSPKGQHARDMVEHGDIISLSIYANALAKENNLVKHGTIREVSLVLAGANPGATIDFVAIRHSDDVLEEIDEAIIHSGVEIDVIHADKAADVKKAAQEDSDDDEDDSEDDDETVQDIYDTLTPKQKDVVNYMVGTALEQAEADLKQSAPTSNIQYVISHNEGSAMGRNVFDQNAPTDEVIKHTLSEEDVKTIVASAVKNGSLKEAVTDWAIQHDIGDIEVLFPDARSVSDRPEFLSRRMDWVANVLGGTKHNPFSRIKTVVADLTQDEARAKGYIKGAYKKEEFFSVQKRVTTPTTIYKKQKLDRDDIVDITDFDIVAWLKAEMRLMLDEELARVILIGDGREVDDADKINELNIRPIANDHELYVTQVNVNLNDAGSNADEIIDAAMANRKYYRGSGNPTFYTTETVISSLLMLKDTLGRRLYANVQELAAVLRVKDIIPVEVMESEDDLVGIIVNLADYTIGADRGGEVNTFDDFDIDYNQQKYLIETRVSGSLTKIKSALVLRKTAGTNVLVAPVKPSFNATTKVITIPTANSTGVQYKLNGTNVATGALPAITADAVVTAVPKTGFYFENSENDEWTYKFTS